MANGSLMRKKTAQVIADFHTGSRRINPVVKERQTWERAGAVLLYQFCL